VNRAILSTSPLNVALLGSGSAGVAGGTLFIKFTTRNTSGVPTTLGGSPVVSVYKDASTTQSIAGVTLIADFDSVTGLNHVTIDTSADAAFYTNSGHFEAVITTGTVGGTSVVGEVVGSFDLAAAAAVPTAAQIASAVWDEVNTGATHNLNNSTGKQLRTAGGGSTGAIYPVSGTVNLTAATGTTATLDASASAVAQAYQWDVLNILTGTGAGQSRIVTNYTTGRVATVSPAWTTTPDASSTFDITPTASVQVVSYVAGQDPATLVWAAGTRTLTGLPTIPNNWLTAAGIAAGALSGKGDWLTSLGVTAPAGWINSAAIAAGALNGKGDWSTYAGTDTAGTTTLLGRIGSAITINGGAVAIDWGHVANPASTVNLSGTTIAGSGGGGSGLTAADVWSYVNRTLTDLPPLPAGWINAAGIAPAALNGKGDWLTPSGTLAHVTAVDTVSGLTDKTGFSLAAGGLDAIAATDPGGVATTWPQMLVAIWRLWFKGSSKTVSDLTIKTYADDGSTVRTTQNYTDDGAGNQTRSAAS